MKNTVQTSGVVFALEPVRSPGRYIQAVFINPNEVQILKCEGKAIHFRITRDIEVEDTVSMKEIASKFVTGDSNIIWNFEVHYKSTVPSLAPTF